MKPDVIKKELSSEEKRTVLALASGKISIRPLKKWVRKDLPKHSPLRYVILKEPDRLTLTDFVSRGMVWYELAKWCTKWSKLFERK